MNTSKHIKTSIILKDKLIWTKFFCRESNFLQNRFMVYIVLFKIILLCSKNLADPENKIVIFSYFKRFNLKNENRESILLMKSQGADSCINKVNKRKFTIYYIFLLYYFSPTIMHQNSEFWVKQAHNIELSIVLFDRIKCAWIERVLA